LHKYNFLTIPKVKMIKSEVLVPLLNANEPEARVVKIFVTDKQPVEKGTILFTIETTKAATDIESSETGVVRLLVKEGDILGVGEKLAVITEFVDDQVNSQSSEQMTPGLSPQQLRITKPARNLAEKLGLDLATFPADKLITEDMVFLYARGELTQVDLPPSGKPYLLVYGGGGHAKSIMEMVSSMGEYTIAGIVDDNLAIGKTVLGHPVLGTRLFLPSIHALGVVDAANAVGGILDINIRVKVFELLLSSGFSLPELLHPRATIEASAKVGRGVQVFANAYIGAEAILEPCCMVNTNAVVSHDCHIGAYTHIAPGALLAGHVHVGEKTLVGMGVTTSVGICIGSGVRIGNGAIILADVPDKAIIQAGRYWVGKAETPG
jgi:sugar O-acyltransferase (sialic acid O-acetyltransferase NeuD family)